MTNTQIILIALAIVLVWLGVVYLTSTVWYKGKESIEKRFFKSAEKLVRKLKKEKED